MVLWAIGGIAYLVAKPYTLSSLPPFYKKEIFNVVLWEHIEKCLSCGGVSASGF